MLIQFISIDLEPNISNRLGNQAIAKARNMTFFL